MYSLIRPRRVSKNAPRSFGRSAALTWAVFNHYTVSTLGENFTQVVFAFQVSGTVLSTGIKWALAIGLVGGLFPALRAARLQVTAGLREV